MELGFLTEIMPGGVSVFVDLRLMADVMFQ